LRQDGLSKAPEVKFKQRMIPSKYISKLNDEAYSIVPEVYSESELDQICGLITEFELEGTSILKSKDIFAIRQLLN
tara:strand:- start:2908 stop:3135 length:228 start_codon:yes stop_codon:yes gene_type:complete